MAGFGDMLQRMARSLEEASAQRPGDDLRARLGYGTGEEDEDELALDEGWERETDRTTDPDSPWQPESDGEGESIWTPAASRAPVRATAPQPMPETPRAARDRAAPGSAPRSAPGSAPRPALRSALRPAPGSGAPSRRASPPTAHRVSTASPISERIRARLHAPDVLRESFVVKEILDRPLGRRRSQ